MINTTVPGIKEKLFLGRVKLNRQSIGSQSWVQITNIAEHRKDLITYVGYHANIWYYPIDM